MAERPNRWGGDLLRDALIRRVFGRAGSVTRAARSPSPGATAARRRRARGVALALLVAAVPAARGQEAAETAADNRRCLNCHGRRQITQMSEQERAGLVSTPLEPRADLERLFFDQERFARSAHRDLRCEDCHPGSGGLPHPARLPAPACAACHAGEGDLYRGSVHAEKRAAGGATLPRCWTCHGGHDVLPPTVRESRTYPLNVLAICSGCHERHGAAPDVAVTGRDLVDRYLDSVHGRAVREAGLTVAATCPDCHRPHDVLPSHDPNSSVYRDRIPQTCGACHVGIAEVYTQSVHSRLNHQGEQCEHVPVCTSCHTAHRITRAATASFARDIVEECGTCHEELYATYRETYHGQVNRLGYRRAARCSDCHGSHDVRTVADPRSHLSAQNKVATCARCHPGATAKFAQFIPHADYRDGSRYPLLHGIWLYFMILMTATFSFFGLHSVLWWIRSLVARLKAGPGRHEQPAGGRTFVRFKPVDRVTHALVITSFMGLTLTGIPLKFSDQPWALVLAEAFGGGNVAGILHRLFAVVLLVYVSIHAVVVWRWIRAKRRCGARGWLFGPESLMPRKKDLRDLAGMFKWFLGRGPLPRFDRWTYWEKFDYWADAAGTLIIGGSGLVLAFPIAATWLLPGWFFNVATIVHGYEALLAVGFIFTMHFFNAHLRVEKFPADTVIFTGKLSEAEFREERPLEYERLEREGRLDELVATPTSRWRLVATRVLGVGLLLIGTTIIVLIIWAGLASLGK